MPASWRRRSTTGPALGAGALVEGPAPIEEPFTVVALAPSDLAVLDQHGNDDITTGPD